MTAVSVVDYRPDDDDEGSGLAYEPEQPSGLSQLAADVDAIVAEPTPIRHPALPDYVMTFRSHIEGSEIDAVQKQTKASRRQVRDMNALLLARTNTGIARAGRPVESEDGQPVTFRHPEFLAAFGAKTAAEAVVAFFKGNDGHLVSVADEVIRAAGYGTGVEVVQSQDPT